MEDIDLELKKVQLARERLALQKETERRMLKAQMVGQLASAGTALKSVGRKIVMLPIAALVALPTFVSKHLKISALWICLGAFCLGAFGVGYLLVEKHLDESNRRVQELNAEKRRAQQLYAEKLQECITEQIPLPTCKERAQKLAFPNGLGDVKLPD